VGGLADLVGRRPLDPVVDELAHFGGEDRDTARGDRAREANQARLVDPEVVHSRHEHDRAGGRTRGVETRAERWVAWIVDGQRALVDARGGACARALESREERCGPRMRRDRSP
jgi:hypothetical protein